MKTKLEVIEETAKFYSEDVFRRAVDSQGSCFYRKNNGTTDAPDFCYCAVGRYIDSKHIAEISNYNSGMDARDLFEKYGFNILQKDVQHITDSKFWKVLQLFHDYRLNWNNKGLTNIGKRSLNSLKLKYSNNETY